MIKTIEQLVTICANKVRIERKSYLNNEEMHCKIECSGFNDTCARYYPMQVSAEHYLVKKETNYN